MSSTFFGLETARRGMFTQQSALTLTGHNIANANTPGYSRQRVNFSATSPFPSVGLNSPKIAGQLGTGVEADSIQRYRDKFLDSQYRGESNKLGYWSARAISLTDIEEVINEPSDVGLAATLNNFWSSIQDLTRVPEGQEEGGGIRGIVRERGREVADTFRYLYTSLQANRNNVKEEINVTLTQVSSIAKQIAEVNAQIKAVEPHGYLPNDLYDRRDLLLDELSELVTVKVTTSDSGGNDLEIAEGIYDIDIMLGNGATVNLVTGDKYQKLEMGPNNSDGSISSYKLTSQDGTSILLNTPFQSSGKLSGLTEVNNEEYKKLLDSLDRMAEKFVLEFNTVHSSGWTLGNQSLPSKTGVNFFTIINGPGSAASIGLSSEIEQSVNNIAAASIQNIAGNRENAQLLANLFKSEFDFEGNGNKTTLLGFYSNKVGELGVSSQSAQRLTSNSQTLRDSVNQRKQSVSGVSLDEEMTNLVQFQHAYNASARMITAVDEVLDKIINGMGHVGR